jgi:hypothetical protein
MDRSVDADVFDKLNICKPFKKEPFKLRFVGLNQPHKTRIKIPFDTQSGLIIWDSARITRDVNFGNTS